MKRVTFHRPERLDPQVVADLLGLVGIATGTQITERWSEIELLVAYDWAMREHLHAADNPVRRRPKPWFVDAMGILGATS